MEVKRSIEVMERDETMAETVVPYMPDEAAIAACQWLPDAALAVYAEEFGRTGFQGGLNWYRCMTGAAERQKLALYAGRVIEVPAVFIAGAQDWGIHQVPGALARMRDEACARMLGVELVPNAGHWVQQEQPEAVVQLLTRFLSY